MTEHRATLSIITANYNHACYLDRVVAQYAGQSRRPDEHVVIDDRSTDDSWARLQVYAQEYPYMRCLRNEVNQGGVVSANRGLLEVCGDFVASIAMDDTVRPDFIEKSMAMLEQYPQAGLCCSLPAMFEEATQHVILAHQSITEACYISPDQFTSLLRSDPMWISGTSVVVRTDLMREFGGWRDDLKLHCDWYAYYCIALRHGFCYIPEPLTSFTVRPGSMSSRKRSFLERVRDYCLLLRAFDAPGLEDVRARFERTNLVAMMRTEGMLAALYCGKWRQVFRPSALRVWITESARSFWRRIVSKVRRTWFAVRQCYAGPNA